MSDEFTHFISGLTSLGSFGIAIVAAGAYRALIGSLSDKKLESWLIKRNKYMDGPSISTWITSAIFLMTSFIITSLYGAIITISAIFTRANGVAAALIFIVVGVSMTMFATTASIIMMTKNQS